MVRKEEKIEQIIKFVQKHPDSFASRTVLRRFGGGSDAEVSEELLTRMGKRMEYTDDTEIDLCYDIIK